MARTIVYNTELDEQQAAAVAIAKKDPERAGEELAQLIGECPARYSDNLNIARAHVGRLERDVGFAGLHLSTMFGLLGDPSVTSRAVCENINVSVELFQRSAERLGELLPLFGRSTQTADYVHLVGEQGASVSGEGRAWFARAIFTEDDAERIEALNQAETAYNRAAELNAASNNAYYAASNHIHLARLLRWQGLPAHHAIREAWRDSRRYPNSRWAARRTIARVGISMFNRRSIERSVRRGGI